MSLLELALVIPLVLLNGFFVVAEYALVRARRGAMEEAAEAGDKRAALVLRQHESIDDYIATSQLGIALCWIGIGAIGEPALADELDGPLGDPVAHLLSVLILVTV